MPGIHWKEREKDTLRRLLLREHIPLPQIELNGRTYRSILSQAVRLGLMVQRPPRVQWPQVQKTYLRKLQAAGYSVHEIIQGQLLMPPPRSSWAIRNQWRRLKLANPKRSRQISRKKVWKSGEKERFYAYLRRVSSTKTPEEIGKEWDLARSTVARHQTALGLKVPRAQVLKMSYSLKKQRGALSKMHQGLARHIVKRRESKARYLVLVAAKLQEGGWPTRACTDCCRPWPLHFEFFNSSLKRTRDGSTRYFNRRCRLCEADRRRQRGKKVRVRARRTTLQRTPP